MDGKTEASLDRVITMSLHKLPRMPIRVTVSNLEADINPEKSYPVGGFTFDDLEILVLRRAQS